MRKRLFVWITSAYLAVCVVLGLALPAAAAGGSGGGAGRAANSCAATNAVADGVSFASNTLLPVNRWANALPLHSRLPGLTDPGSWGANMARSITQTSMSIGNGLWSLASMVTDRSQRFCMGTDAAGAADTVTATLGKAFIESGIFPAIVVFALLGLLYRASRGGHFASAAARIGLAVAAAVMLYNGASGTHVGTQSAGGYESFGVGGPGWFANTINNNIQTLAAGPVESVNDMVQKTNKVASGSQSSSPLDCRTYIEKLNEKYKASYADISTAVDGQQMQKAAMAGSIAPLTLNQMWLQTGYSTWVNIQFGPTGMDPYGPKVGCRLLDYSTNETPESIMALTSEAAGTGFSNKGSLAWTAFGDNTQIDQAMVAWAACDGSGAVDSGWSGALKDNPVTGEACTQFFDGDRWQWYNAPTPFDFPDDLKKNTDRITDPKVASYVEFLHGNRSSEAMATALVYVVASAAVSGVFVMLGLAVFIAKTALLVVAALAFVVLMAGVLTAGRPGVNDPVSNLLKHFVVLAFFAYATSAVLALVSLLTSIIAGLGTSAVGDGTLASSMWVGLSPVATLILLDQVFKRLLKVPSPFSMKGAAAWGVAAAGTGFLAGNAFNRQHQVENAFNRTQNAVKNVATGNGLSPNRGNRSERTGAMKPVAGNGGLTGYQESQRRKQSASDLKAVHAEQKGAKSAKRGEQSEKVKNALLGGAQVPTLADDGSGELTKTERAAAAMGLTANNLADKTKTGASRAVSAVKADPKAAAKAGVAGALVGARAAGRGVKTAGATVGSAAKTGAKRTLGEVKRSARGGMDRVADKFADKPLTTTVKTLGVGAAALALGAPLGLGAVAVAGGAYAALGARQGWKDHREHRTATRATRRSEMAAMQAETGMSRHQIRQAQKAVPAYQKRMAEAAKADDQAAEQATSPAGPAPDLGSGAAAARAESSVSGSMGEQSDGRSADTVAPDVLDTPGAGVAAPGVAVSGHVRDVGYIPPTVQADSDIAEAAVRQGVPTTYAPNSGVVEGAMEPGPVAPAGPNRYTPPQSTTPNLDRAPQTGDAAAMPPARTSQQAPLPQAPDALQPPETGAPVLDTAAAPSVSRRVETAAKPAPVQAVSSPTTTPVQPAVRPAPVATPAPKTSPPANRTNRPSEPARSQGVEQAREQPQRPPSGQARSRSTAFTEPKLPQGRSKARPKAPVQQVVPQAPKTTLPRPTASPTAAPGAVPKRSAGTADVGQAPAPRRAKR